MRPYGQETEWDDMLWAKKHKQPKKAARRAGKTVTAEELANWADETVGDWRASVTRALLLGAVDHVRAGVRRRMLALP